MLSFIMLNCCPQPPPGLVEEWSYEFMSCLLVCPLILTLVDYWSTFLRIGSFFFSAILHKLRHRIEVNNSIFWKINIWMKLGKKRAKWPKSLLFHVFLHGNGSLLFSWVFASGRLLNYKIDLTKFFMKNLICHKKNIFTSSRQLSFCGCLFCYCFLCCFFAL